VLNRKIKAVAPRKFKIVFIDAFLYPGGIRTHGHFSAVGYDTT
jgi:hypothetical protein